MTYDDLSSCSGKHIPVDDSALLPTGSEHIIEISADQFRNETAARILARLVSRPNTKTSVYALATFAVEVTDALIRELNK
jgi:hypothetical protein